MSQVIDVEVTSRPANSFCAAEVDGGFCGEPLPLKGEEGYHPKRKYCTPHQPASSSGAAKRKLAAASSGGVAPPRIENNFIVKVPKTSKLTGDLADVEAGAQHLLDFIPMIMAAIGDQVCPPLLEAAIPDIAKQLALLSKYHPGLKKLLAPGASTGELMAWIGLVIVTAPLVIAILAHHDLVKGKVGERITAAATFGSAFGKAVVDESAAEVVVDDTGS